MLKVENLKVHYPIRHFFFSCIAEKSISSICQSIDMYKPCYQYLCHYYNYCSNLPVFYDFSCKKIYCK